MADQTQRLEIATVKAEVGSNILFRFANDAANAGTIPTDSGGIPNLKQVVVEIQSDAADKISIATTIYQSPAAGLAATADGGIFLVQSADADTIYTVWKNQAGAAVNTGKTAMSSEAIQEALTASNEAAQAAEDAADVATERTAGLLLPAAEDPTVRDNGLPLQIGDRYFNTVEQTEYIYKAEGWLANDSLEAISLLEQSISETPGVGEIPRATNVGTLDEGWLPSNFPRYSDVVLDGQTVQATLDKAAALKDWNVGLRNFGAIGDGNSHPLSSKFANLDAAKVVYPFATSMSDEIDWCAMQAAINSPAKSIYPGDGTFVFNKGHIVKNKDKSFFGNGSKSTQFLYTGQGDGLRFEQNKDYDSHCIGVFVATNLLNTGKGLSASYVGFTGTYERNRRYQVFSMCRVSGQDYFQHGWKINVELDEVTLPLVSACQLIGRRDVSKPASGATHWWPWTTYNLNYTSSTNLEPTDGLFEDVLSNYAQYGFNIRGTLEGMRFHKIVNVATQWGIYNDMRAVTGSPSINPWLHAVDSHFNCSAGAVYSTYCYEGFVSRNLFYKFDQVDEAYTAITTSFGNNWKVTSNHVDGVAGSTGMTTFMKCQQNNDSKVHDNHGNMLDQGVVVDGTGGITGFETYNNKLKGRDGNEVTQAVYTNSADPLKNPASIQGGIVAQDSNAAVVAIASGGFSTIASFSLDAYPVGAVFLITAICQITKGGTPGSTKLYVEKTAGSGNVTYMNNATGMGVQNDSQGASTNWQATLSGIIKKAAAGPVTLKLAVSSGGSNASVAALDGQYVLTRIG